MKIATLLLKYDYGIKERGVSLEKKHFYPSIAQYDNTSMFWLEDNGFPDDLNGLQENIKTFIEATNPDMVFTILMNNEIYPQTFDWMREKGVYCVNWFCDDMWRFEWSREVAKHLSLAVTVDKYSVQKYRGLGLSAVHGMWGAGYLSSDYSIPSYTEDVSFVGSRNDVREWYVQELKNRGILVNCYGSGWDNGRLSDMELWSKFRHSKINLNLSNSIPMDIRFHKWLQDNNRQVSSGKFVEQIKARHFEIPGAGGFQLTHYAPEIEDYFDIGKEIAIYGNVEDMVRQIEYYLANTEERELIKGQGHRKARKYTYDKQIRRVLDEVSNFMGRRTVSK